MGANFDLDTNYLERRLGRRIHTFGIPGNREPELKLIIHDPEYFDRIYEVLRARAIDPSQDPLTAQGDIILSPQGMIPKDYFLINVALDTYDARDESKTRLFDKAGLQARMRTAIWADGTFRKPIEFNFKTKLDARPSAPAQGHRIELEHAGMTFREAFESMKTEAALAEAGLNLDEVDMDSVFGSVIAASSRAHGEFAHRLNMAGRTYWIKYMPTHDHTAHIGIYGNHFIGSDLEAEYEARGVVAPNPNASQAEIEDAIDVSQAQLKSILMANVPELWLSHRSKIGRSTKALRRESGMSEESAVRAMLAHRITPDHVLGNRSFGGHHFMRNLSGTVNKHLLSGAELAGSAAVSTSIEPVVGPAATSLLIEYA